MGSKSLLLVAWVAMISLGLRADDWPQWRGPKRDGISREKGLLTEWPAGGPKKLWSASGLGQGFSTVAVVGNTIYTTGIVDGEGKLIALRDDGTVLGKSAFGKDASEGGGHPGTRSTPTVADGRIFVMSAFGVVTCFDQKSGQKQWQVDTFKDMGGRQLQWNVSESILVDGRAAICTPGGPEALVAALDCATGKTLWTTRGLDSKSGYCSPMAVTHNDRRIILTMVEFGAVGIDAASGQLLWKYAHKNRYAVHAATPVYADGKVVFSSGYGYGTEALALSPKGDGVKVLWQDKALANHHGGIILRDGVVYGTSDGGLVCLDFQSGKVNWTEKAVGKGSITVADDLLYAYAERGTVSLVQVSPASARVLGSFQVQEGAGPHWAHPVVANGRLYIRHGDVLQAYDIRKP